MTSCEGTDPAGPAIAVPAIALRRATSARISRIITSRSISDWLKSLVTASSLESIS